MADATYHDVIIIGGGMAGASTGYELAEELDVCLLEAESTLAYHSTGRSAATFLETYGGPEIRALTASSRAFLTNLNEHFESEVLLPLPMLRVALEEQSDDLKHMYDELGAEVDGVTLLSGLEAEQLNPALRPGTTALAMIEAGAMEVDVHAMHGGFVRGMRSRGATVVTSARVAKATHEGAAWKVTDEQGREFWAPVIVNAAGAWVDQVAAIFGASPVTIRPMRRSVFMLNRPEHIENKGIPLTAFYQAKCYMKPEGDRFLCSPADENPHDPSDAKPDQLEIARALDIVAERTIIETRYVSNAWAGLRSFVADRVPVVGFDPSSPGFFWVAGQGGYGIQTAPSMARTAAALIRVSKSLRILPSADLIRTAWQQVALRWPASYSTITDIKLANHPRELSS